MGCNSSKDGSNPSGDNAQGGGNAPTDKPANDSAQQSSGNDKAASTHTQDEVQEFNDDPPSNIKHSQMKYKVPSENGAEDKSEANLDANADDNNKDELEISNLNLDESDNDSKVDKAEVAASGGEVTNLQEPQAEGGEQTAADQQAEES